MEAWARMSAAALGREIGAGRVDPRALAEFLLDRAAQSPHRDRIFTRLTPARARAEARAAHERARAGTRCGPLDGVPVTLKDLFDSAGAETEAGSRLLAGRIPARDAEAVRRLAAAGLVCLGKTQMSELAFSGLGLNPRAATPPNRFDHAAAPGGSSSGAAASVAFDLAPLALGSDTGGSVRIPAAWNGLVGLKTSWGLIPNDGVVPLAPSLDTIGPLTRDVADSALMLAALTGRPAPDLAGARLKGARVFVPETTVFDDAEDAPIAAFEAAAEALAREGATLLRGPMPEFAEALEIAARDGAIVNTEGWAVWRATIEAAPGVMHPFIEQRFRSGAGFRSDQIEGARLAFARLARACRARWADCDALLCPTVPILPPDAARLEADAEFYAERNLLALRNTRLGNLFGFCALTLPTPRPACGIMLTGRAGEEARLLRLGAAMEAALAG